MEVKLIVFLYIKIEEHRYFKRKVRNFAVANVLTYFLRVTKLALDCEV